MFLILKVISCDGDAPATPLSARIDESGGGIGRSAKMSLRLHDPERIVSSQHALITFKDGQFFITDNSTNGTFVHGSETPMQTGSAVPIAPGDQFQIGRYVIAAELGQQAVGQAPPAPAPPVPPPAPAGGLGAVLDNEKKHSIDDFLNSGPGNAPMPRSEIPLSGAPQQPEANHLIPGNNPIIPNDFGREDAGSGNPSPGIAAPQSDGASLLASAFQVPKPVADSAPPPPPPVVPPAPPAVPAVPAVEDPPAAASQMIPKNWDGGGEDAAVPDRAAIPAGGLEPPAPLIPPLEEQIPPLAEQIPPLAQQVPEPAEPAVAPVGTGAEPPAAVRVAADTGSMPQIPTPQPASPASPASQGSGGPELMARILAAAGFDAADLSGIAPETMAENIGLILREAVCGITEAMRDRANFKGEFRLDLTRIQSDENNPLKFSTSLDDVVKQLLAGDRPGLVPPGAAFREAFDDLRVHQLAMMVGVKVCLSTLVARLDPNTIEEQLDKRSSRKAALLSSRKALCWELYNEIFEDIGKDADDGFRRLLAEDFASAYEEQVNSMKRARFKNKA